MAKPEIRDNSPDQQPPLTRKERLAAKFENWPLIRLMIFSPVFLVVILFFFLSAAVLGLALPKIWRMTPPEFTPEVKISLLDRWQTMSLRRTAQAAEQRGEIKAAYDGWRASWANNLADQQSLRGLLAIIPKLDDTEDAAGAAVQAGYWLMRLGGTNTTDLELIARAWVNTRNTTLADRAAGLLDSKRGQMPENLERLYLMALFQANRTAEFGMRMRENRMLLAEVDRQRARFGTASGVISALSGFKTEEPKFEYYCLAFLIGWGTDDDRLAARDRLREARQVRATEQLAFDLEYITMQHLRDTEACGKLLREMQDLGHDSIRHHTAYWGLLAYDGRKAQAEQLAQTSNLTPRNGFEAFRLALAFTQLELSDRASDLVNRFSENVGWASELLVLQSDLLIRSQAWDELRSLALKIRMMPQAMDYLGGYCFYLEGLADWRTGDREAAAVVFTNAVKTGISDPRIALKAGEGLTALGQIKFAEPILLAQRNALSDNQEYLRLLVKVGSYSKNADDMLKAAKDLYDKQPRDPVAVNNYAAALMVFRKNPEEALELVKRLMGSYSNSPEMKANYAAALAMVGRYSEAETAMREVNLSRFRPPELSQYYLTYFEICAMTGRTADARRYLRLIDKNQLYPVQAEWIDQIASSLGPDNSPPAKP